MVVPPRLRKGDMIGIVSPSEAVTAKTRHFLDKGIRFLQALGFKTLLGRNALKVYDYSAGTPQERADDINRMFADKHIKAIICSQGGSTANSCIPLLDWNVIKRNPKIFQGISDNSVLLNAIHYNTGLVTFHGNDLIWGFGRKPTRYDRDEFLRRLVEGETGLVRKNSEWKSIRRGSGTGRLIGGNLGSLLKLAGTPCFPDFDRAILFVEGYSPSPSSCDYMFTQLRQIGVFDQINGALVGYVHGMQAKKTKMIQMEEILLRVADEYDFPILKSNDFGHECPNTVLPVGTEVRLDADHGQLEILEPCVK